MPRDNKRRITKTRQNPGHKRKEQCGDSRLGFQRNYNHISDRSNMNEWSGVSGICDGPRNGPVRGVKTSGAVEQSRRKESCVARLCRKAMKAICPGARHVLARFRLKSTHDGGWWTRRRDSLVRRISKRDKPSAKRGIYSCVTHLLNHSP